jgi:3-deoxy-D-manno-octulosonic-acid transferase
VHAALRPFYDAAAQLARLGAAVVPGGKTEGSSKLARALAARRGIDARYAAWGAAHRDRERALLWMHAPSVGEGLQARPVLERLRAVRRELQLAYTFYSPSAEAFAARLNVDFRDYLPFDTVGEARAALDALAPTALVFSKLDVWPTLTREAAARRVGLGMISATFSSRSSRGGVWGSLILRDAYAQLDLVGAVDDNDARRLVALGVRASAIEVTGDTRYDQVWQRASQVNRASELLAPLATTRPTIVAGSTWPADEARLMIAFLALREAVPRVRLIIAPHEPTGDHLEPLEAWARRARVALSRLGEPGAAAADIVLVDRVGVLGDLYALADVAYVGGGFHGAGLHSVLEPAAFGVPVVFGPRHSNSRDAGLMIAADAAVAANNEHSLQQALAHFLTASGERAAAGARAKAFVKAGLGAAERSVKLVERLLDAGGGRGSRPRGARERS